MTFPTDIYANSVRKVVENGRFESRIVFYTDELLGESPLFKPAGLVVLRKFDSQKDLTLAVMEAMMYWATVGAQHAVISLDLWESSSEEPDIRDPDLRRVVYVHFHPEGLSYRIPWEVDDWGKPWADDPELVGLATTWSAALDEMKSPVMAERVPNFLRSRGHGLIDLREE